MSLRSVREPHEVTDELLFICFESLKPVNNCRLYFSVLKFGLRLFLS